jgi:hypothetical protein
MQLLAASAAQARLYVSEGHCKPHQGEGIAEIALVLPDVPEAVSR